MTKKNWCGLHDEAEPCQKCTVEEEAKLLGLARHAAMSDTYSLALSDFKNAFNPSKAQRILETLGEVRKELESAKHSVDAMENARDVYRRRYDKEQAKTEVYRRNGVCKVCGHAFSRHDPEDLSCDAPAEEGLGVCPCGRSQ